MEKSRIRVWEVCVYFDLTRLKRRVAIEGCCRRKSMSHNNGMASLRRQSSVTALLFMPPAQLSSTVPLTSFNGAASAQENGTT